MTRLESLEAALALIRRKRDAEVLLARARYDESIEELEQSIRNERESALPDAQSPNGTKGT